MVGAEAEPLRHAGAQRGQRLERLGRGADEDRRAGVLPAGHGPRDVMLALDRRAAVHADDGLPDHDARIWYTDVKPVSKPLRAARRYSRHTRTRSGPASRIASSRFSSSARAHRRSVSA